MVIFATRFLLLPVLDERLVRLRRHDLALFVHARQRLVLEQSCFLHSQTKRESVFGAHVHEWLDTEVRCALLVQRFRHVKALFPGEEGEVAEGVAEGAPCGCEGGVCWCDEGLVGQRGGGCGWCEDRTEACCFGVGVKVLLSVRERRLWCVGLECFVVLGVQSWGAVFVECVVEVEQRLDAGAIP